MQAQPLRRESGEPIRYGITVAGRLDPAWSSRMGEMQITYGESEDREPITWLSGVLADQAALVGVINSLYGLRLSILSVSVESSGAGERE